MTNFECCATCRFSYDYQSEREVRDDETIECRRFPPVLKAFDEDGELYSFTCTLPHKWCGEYKPKEEQ